MMSTRKRLLAVAAAAAIWATVQPGTVSAQTSGVNTFGWTVIRWAGDVGDGTYDTLALWELDSNLNYIQSRNYGPFPGYVPLFSTTVADGATYVLWQYQDGSINLWSVDANLNLTNTHAYGPFPGWHPEGLSPDTAGLTGPNSFRVIWRNDNWQVNVWEVDDNLNAVAFHAYGPAAGWYPGTFGSILTPAPGQQTPSAAHTVIQ
jgi:hypothetical protein